MVRAERRPHFKSISIEEKLYYAIEPIAQKKVMGVKSVAEFVSDAAREKLEKYHQLGLHPWSRFSSEVRKHASKHSENLAIILILVLGFSGLWLLWFPGASITGFVPAPDLVSTPLHISVLFPFSPVMDFFLYLAVFVGLSWVTIGRRFQNRGLAVAVGTVLAVSLASAAPKLGFRIESLGPIAATIIILAVSYPIYWLLRKMGLGSVGAISTSILFVYAGLGTYSPTWIDAIVQRLPFLPFVAIGLLILVVYKMSTTLFPRKSDPRKFPEMRPSVWEYAPSPKQEQEVVQMYLGTITRQARKESRQVIAELTYVSKVLVKFADSPTACYQISRRLHDIPPTKHDVRRLLKKMHKCIDQLQRMDFRSFKHLKKDYSSMPSEEKEQIMKRMKIILNRIGALKKIKEFERDVEVYEAAFAKAKNNAADELAAANVNRCQKFLRRAIELERSALKLLAKMDEFIQQLLAIPTSELPQLQEQ